MRILISAIGSMSADAVIKSLRSITPVLIVGTDIHPGNWLHLSEEVDFFYQVPRVTESTYLDRMIEICKSNRIEYLIPLTDPEVDLISQHRSLFNQVGTAVALSCEETVSLCRNKLSLYQRFRTSNIVKVIPSFTYDELNLDKVDYPMIAKLVNGRSSEGLRFIQDLYDLKSMVEKMETYIFQPYIRGQIYTVDVLLDSVHHFIAIPRKELIRTSNGAGLTIQIEKNEELIKQCHEIAMALNVLGCMNFEFIFNGTHFLLMDINPRFSAGIGFSKLAGYDFVINHFNVFARQDITVQNDFQEILAVKHYSDFIIEK